MAVVSGHCTSRPCKSCSYALQRHQKPIKSIEFRTAQECQSMVKPESKQKKRVRGPKPCVCECVLNVLALNPNPVCE
eukprot:1059372-Pelagomonas_calceolata.AAC.16